MKALLPILTLVFLAACANQRLDRRIDEAGWDSLADESYLRWGEKRLKTQSGKEHEVTKCYQGKSRETLTKYRKEYLTKSQTSYYWLHIGNCYFVENLWSKAEFFYRLSLDEAKAPEIKSIALNNLGLLHFKYEQWEKGKTYLKQSIALAPNFKVPRYNMSQLYLQFGFYDKAIEVLSNPAFSSNKDIDVYFSLANAYLYKGDLNMAAQYFRLIPPEQFKREDIAATYALYLIRTGKVKQAKKVMAERERSGVLEITAISQKIEKILAQRMKEE